MEYEFTLVFVGLGELSDEFLHELVLAGCDDCTPALRSGVVCLTVQREASSKSNAMSAVVAQLRAAGFAGPVALLLAS